jgi:hypothetical protein
MQGRRSCSAQDAGEWRKRQIAEQSSTLQEWGKVPTANSYADGQMSVPSA